MKKLIAMIGAAVLGAGAWATTYGGGQKYIVPADFEAGPTNIVGYSDDAQTSVFDTLGCVFWFANNFPTTKAGLTDYEQPAEVAVDETLGEKVLKIEADTAAPMLRTFNPTRATQIGDADEYSFASEAQPIGDLGLFADTKIKLSASEDVPQDFTGKLAVWLHAVPAEEGVTEGFTNLMVTCGQLNDQYKLDGATNIAIAADGVTVKPEEWHQITIRSIKEIKTGETIPGFVIYVDGKLAQAKADDYVLPTGLTGKAAEFANLHALFASASSEATTIQTLESVGFAGNGSLSYIDLTDMANAPLFAQDPTSVRFVFDVNVESITINDVNIIDGKTGSVDFQITDFENATVATIAYADGYRGKQVVNNDDDFFDSFNVSDDKKTATFKVTRFTAGGIVTIDSELDRDVAAVTIGGVPVEKRFSSLADIFTYLMGQTLTPGAAINIALKENVSSQGIYNDLEDNAITIDLKGFTLNGLANPSATPGYDYLISNAGNMTIVDTVGGGQIVAGECNGIIYNFALCSLTLGEGGIKYTGTITNEEGKYEELLIFGEITIFDGKFKPNKLTVDGKNIKWGDNNLEWGDQVDGFWPVVKNVPPTGTVIIITYGGATTNWFPTIAEAVEAATAGDTIQLLADQNMAAMVDITKTVAIDLNGKTVAPAAENLKTLFHVYNGGVLNITGTTDGSAMKGRITVGKGTNQNGTLTINGGTYTAGTFRNGAFDDNNEDCFIQSNGTCDNCVVTATDAIFNSKDDTFYLAAKGTYTFTRCTINGYTGIYAKGGTVNLVDTDVIATGAKAVPKEDHNGASSTGDAVIFDSLAGYNGEMSLNVDADSKLSSANGYAFQETVSDGKSPSATIAVAIDPNATLRGEIKLSDNFAAKVATGGASITGYVATVDGIAYASAAAALAAVQAKEVGDDYTIKVAALAALELTQDPQTIKLAKGDTVTITQNKWAFSGALDGTIVLLPGKTITAASEAAGLSVITLSVGDEVVKTPGTPITWTVQAIPTFDVTFTKDNVEVGSPKTVKRDYALTKGDIPEVTDEGAWDVQPVGAVITCNTNFNFTVKKGGVTPEKEPETDNGKANLAKLNEVLGDKAADWQKAVYGEGNKVPVAALEASTPELIEAAAAYNLKVMADPVTITPAAVEGGFTFTLKDKLNENPVVAASKVQEMMAYTSDLKVNFARDAAKKAIKAEYAEGAIKVEFTYKDLADEDANAGFMKVDLSVTK